MIVESYETIQTEIDKQVKKQINKQGGSKEAAK
jgi:hypothetical protein